jgi:hypothetical protein
VVKIAAWGYLRFIAAKIRNTPRWANIITSHPKINTLQGLTKRTNKLKSDIILGMIAGRTSYVQNIVLIKGARKLQYIRVTFNAYSIV